jgi:CheY-like chemotaxis protein
MTGDDAATILVVEDDHATRTFLADNLTADGYELLVAETARDGLRLLETKFPDLALLDLNLPDGSGYDLVRRVREAGHAIGSHGHTHRVMTTLADAEISEEWRRSKAVLEDVLGAPVTVLSVPTGFYTSRVGRIAAEAGYRHLFTSEPRVRPRSLSGALVYGRFSVLASTPAARVEQLCRFSRGALWREGAKWYAKRVPKILLRGHYERVRRFVLARQATIWRSGEREAR